MNVFLRRKPSISMFQGYSFLPYDHAPRSSPDRRLQLDHTRQAQTVRLASVTPAGYSALASPMPRSAKIFVNKNIANAALTPNITIKWIYLQARSPPPYSPYCHCSSASVSVRHPEPLKPGAAARFLCTAPYSPTPEDTHQSQRGDFCRGVYKFLGGV